MDFRHRMFWRIVALLGLLIALSCLVMGISAVQMNRHDHKRRGHEQAFLVAQQGAALIHWDDRVAVRALLDHAISANPVLRYAFVERSGKAYVESPAVGIPRELLCPADRWPHQEFERQFQDSAGCVFYDIAVAVPGEQAAVHIGLDRAGVDRVGWSSLVWLAAIGVGVFLLFLPAVRGVALAITREVDAMTLRLREANDTLETRVVTRTAEITRLNTALEQRIAKHKATELKLEEEEEHLRVFKESVENSTDAVGMSTPEGKHYYQNKTFDHLFGQVGENPVGSVYVDPAVGHEVFRTIMAGGQWTGEVQMYAKDRRILDILLRAYATKDHSGRLTTLVGIHTDITERKQLEVQRRELDARLHQTQRIESLGVLAGGIAHDFNNILMAILGHADLALDEMSPQAPGRESIQQITTAAMRAAELCTQMLAYSGKGRIERRDFCLSSLVDEMLHMLKTCISKKCVLNLNLEKQLFFMHGDVSQIRQVLMNLVMNASEAIGDRSGSITVSTGAMDCPKEYLDQNYIAQPLSTGLYVYLEVSDTGCGMSRETTQRMFEPFFTTKFTGRGLGLAAVMGIVQAHSGALRVYSELGKGTTIKVLFPATTGAEVGPESPAESRWRGRGTVLLVDDEETVRAVTGKLLARLGLDVLTAADGRESVALYRARKAEIGVVLLDLTMPHMNGEEAFRELRQINPAVRVILASGYSENDIAARFVGKGLAGCMQKPYTLAKLRSMLSALLPAADAPRETDQNPGSNQASASPRGPASS